MTSGTGKKTGGLAAVLLTTLLAWAALTCSPATAATTPPSLTAPVAESIEEGNFKVTYSLPEAALANSVDLLFEDEAHKVTSITLANTAMGSDTIEVDPSDPTSVPGVVSSNGELASGVYELKAGYQNSAGEPPAFSTAVRLTVFQAARCKPGTYSATGEVPCDECTRGTFSEATGADVCQLASPGHYVSEPGQSAQKPCEAGTYTDVTQTIECPRAPVGHYAEGLGTVFPTACPAGTNDPHLGSTSHAECEPDRPGTYSGEAAAVATPCEAGTFASAYESKQCLPAPAGYYVASAEAASATPCSAGAYASATRSTSCTPTPPDTYATGGAGAPIPCPAGTESPAGASACTPIPTSLDNGGPPQSSTPSAPTFEFQAPHRQLSLRRTRKQLYAIKCSESVTVVVRATVQIALGHKHVRLAAIASNKVACTAGISTSEQVRFKLTTAAKAILAHAKARVTISFSLKTTGTATAAAGSGTIHGMR